MSTGTPEHQVRQSPELSERSDAELLAATRTGDQGAYGELFRRHAPAATALARRLTGHPSDADDLVSESFTKVLAALRNGKGPTSALRPYLLTAVRRVHVDRAVAGKRVQPTDDMSAHDPGVPFVDPALAGLERSMVTQAYQQLPERWQMVLWHTEVEELSPKDIAPLLGMSPNAVAALALRARAGLREAYLAAHVTTTASPECERMLPKLAAYVRGSASARERSAVERHLPDCEDCRGVLAELQDVGGRMRAVIAPLILGVAATGYLADLAAMPAAAAPLTAAAAAATPVAVPVPSGAEGAAAGSAGGGGGAGGGATSAIGGWVAGSAAAVIVVGAVIGAVVLAQNASETPNASNTSTAEGVPGAGSQPSAQVPTQMPDDAPPVLGPEAPRATNSTPPNLRGRTQTSASPTTSPSTSPTSLPSSVTSTPPPTSRTTEPTNSPTTEPSVSPTTSPTTSPSPTTSEPTTTTTTSTTEPPPPPPTLPTIVGGVSGDFFGGDEGALDISLEAQEEETTLTLVGWTDLLEFDTARTSTCASGPLDVVCTIPAGSTEFSVPIRSAIVETETRVMLTAVLSRGTLMGTPSSVEVVVRPRPVLPRYTTTGQVTALGSGGTWINRGAGNVSVSSNGEFSLPSTAIRYAEVYWAGHEPGQGLDGPSRDSMNIHFTDDGVPVGDRIAVTAQQTTNLTSEAGTWTPSFVSRADVTSLIQTRAGRPGCGQPHREPHDAWLGGRGVPHPGLDHGRRLVARDRRGRPRGVRDHPVDLRPERHRHPGQPFSTRVIAGADSAELLGWGAGSGTEEILLDDELLQGDLFARSVVWVPVAVEGAGSLTVSSGGDDFAISSILVRKDA